MTLQLELNKESLYAIVLVMIMAENVGDMNLLVALIEFLRRQTEPTK